MNLNKIKKYLIISLVLFEVCVIHLAYKSFSNKPVKLPEVKLKEIEKEKKNTYAVMIDDGNGGYTESTEDKFPTEGYKLNTEKSGCIDNEGNAIENVLSVVDNKVLVSTGSTTYCYLYFDKTMIAKDFADNPIPGVQESTGVAQDELVTRYYGTNPPNYICFGTSDKEECVNDTEKYMYRIIGVTKDTGKGNMFKVIKKEILNTQHKWYSDDKTDIKWPQSEVYNQINGSSFLSNSDYVPNEWADKIEIIDWKYGDFTDNNKTAAQIVQQEQAWSTTVNAKIGLMYVADYYFAYQKSGLNCSSSGQSSTCKTSWMHYLNNGTEPFSAGERTMSRYGRYSSGYYTAWLVAWNGDANFSYWYFSNNLFARPVFYLKSDVAVSGSGTISDPYMIIT